MLIIIILAIIQTFAFFYLCIKLYSAHRKRKNLTSSPKIKNSSILQYENNTLNYAIYPTSTLTSNYKIAPGIINAYSPTTLLNSKSNKFQVSTLKSDDKCQQYFNENKTNYNKAATICSQNKKFCTLLQNYNENNNQVSYRVNNNYSEIDEHAAALAVASMSLTRPTSKISNFDYKYGNNSNNITELKNFKVPTLSLKKENYYNQKRHSDESPIGSDLSTMSSSSASTNFTALSFFSGDYDKKNPLHLTIHENTKSNEEINIEFEGASASTPVFQTFGINSTKNTFLHNHQQHLQDQRIEL